MREAGGPEQRRVLAREVARLVAVRAAERPGRRAPERPEARVDAVQRTDEAQRAHVRRVVALAAALGRGVADDHRVASVAGALERVPPGVEQRAVDARRRLLAVHVLRHQEHPLVGLVEERPVVDARQRPLGGLRRHLALLPARPVESGNGQRREGVGVPRRGWGRVLLARRRGVGPGVARRHRRRERAEVVRGRIGVAAHAGGGPVGRRPGDVEVHLDAPVVGEAHQVVVAPPVRLRVGGRVGRAAAREGRLALGRRVRGDEPPVDGHPHPVDAQPLEDVEGLAHLVGRRVHEHRVVLEQRLLRGGRLRGGGEDDRRGRGDQAPEGPGHLPFPCLPSFSSAPTTSPAADFRAPDCAVAGLRGSRR